MPTVSVVIPTYNRRDCVLETLASVWAQDCPDCEIIVVNDGSPDDTAARLRPLAEAGRLRYLEQPNAGQAAARNAGLAAARGEFVSFLDDDDLWPPGKLTWQVAALREHPDWLLVAGLAGFLWEDGARSEPEDADGSVQMQSVESLCAGSLIYTPGQALIRRAALDAVGAFDPAIRGTEDLDLWMRLAAHGPVALVRRGALSYRQHAASVSKAAARMFWSAVGTVRKNLPLVPPARRASAWRAALRGAYGYSGTRVVGAARAGGGWRERRAAVGVLAFLAGPMLRDRELAKMIGRDLLPARLRRALAGKG